MADRSCDQATTIELDCASVPVSRGRTPPQPPLSARAGVPRQHDLALHQLRGHKHLAQVLCGHASVAVCGGHLREHPGADWRAVRILHGIQRRVGASFCLGSKLRRACRSKLFVLDNLVVDNNGLHLSREICRPFYTPKGLVRVRVTAFVNNGEFILHAYWRGADTLGNKMLLRSEDAKAHLPELLPASEWALRMFSSSKPLEVESSWWRGSSDCI
eukprot:764625-Hanusia_phi.AAC.2